jgi:hypothetical protein
MKHVSFFTTPGIGPGNRSFYIISDSRERSDQVQHKAITAGYRYHGTVMVEDDLKEVKVEAFLQKDWEL